MRAKQVRTRTYALWLLYGDARDASDRFEAQLLHGFACFLFGTALFSGASAGATGARLVLRAERTAAAKRRSKRKTQHERRRAKKRKQNFSFSSDATTRSSIAHERAATARNIACTVASEQSVAAIDFRTSIVPPMMAKNFNIATIFCCARLKYFACFVANRAHEIRPTTSRKLQTNYATAKRRCRLSPTYSKTKENTPELFFSRKIWHACVVVFYAPPPDPAHRRRSKTRYRRPSRPQLSRPLASLAVFRPFFQSLCSCSACVCVSVSQFK